MFWHIALAAIFGLVLGLAAAWDLCTGEILNRYAVLLLGLGAVHLLIKGCSWNSLGDCLAGSGVAAGLMLVIALINDGFGGGDIKLVGAGGFYLGFIPSLFALLLSCLIAAAAWIILRQRGKATLSTKMKYGPCYAIGAVISAILCFV